MAELTENEIQFLISCDMYRTYENDKLDAITIITENELGAKLLKEDLIKLVEILKIYTGTCDVQKSVSKTIIKGAQVSYISEYHIDEDNKSEYTTTELDTRNLNRAINAYWICVGKPENIQTDLNSEPKFP